MALSSWIWDREQDLSMILTSYGASAQTEQGLGQRNGGDSEYVATVTGTHPFGQKTDTEKNVHWVFFSVYNSYRRRLENFRPHCF